MAAVQQIVADLRAESDELDALVAPLAEARWAAPTPAAGWTIAHQIGHLLWTDRGSLTAISDEAAFAGLLQTAAADPIGFVEAGAAELGATAPAELLADWRTTRTRLHDALLTVPDGRKLPWFGPGGRGAAGARRRRGLLLCGHPTACAARSRLDRRRLRRPALAADRPSVRRPAGCRAMSARSARRETAPHHRSAGR